MMTQPTQPGTTPDESTTVSRDENRVGAAAENQGEGGGGSGAAGSEGAGQPAAGQVTEHGRHRAPVDADDPRPGGHPERAPRSLHAVELLPDDEPIASNDEWDEPERL